jgi:hypothetical protein
MRKGVALLDVVAASAAMWALIIWGALSLVGCDAAPALQQPPERYRPHGETTISVTFSEDPYRACQARGWEGPKVGGCGGRGWAIMPYPYGYPSGPEYRDLMGHELGHGNPVNPWPPNHPE